MTPKGRRKLRYAVAVTAILAVGGLSFVASVFDAPSEYDIVAAETEAEIHRLEQQPGIHVHARITEARVHPDTTWCGNQAIAVPMEGSDGLVWFSEPSAAARERTFDDASSFCGTLKAAGLSGWRLPKAFEVRFARPARIPPGDYWTSYRFQDDAGGDAWSVRWSDQKQDYFCAKSPAQDRHSTICVVPKDFY